MQSEVIGVFVDGTECYGKTIIGEYQEESGWKARALWKTNVESLEQGPLPQKRWNKRKGKWSEERER